MPQPAESPQSTEGPQPPDGWGFTEGDPITEHLRAVRRLGGGAAYEAYLAFDEITWGPVVVKVLRPGQVADPSSLRGLRREVAALQAVNHPVVVRMLRHEETGERPYVVLEALDGPRLSSLIRRYGPLQAAQYLPLGIEVASAMEYLRRIGFVHLDIKPSNIIMGAPARLIDLSVARSAEAAARLDHPIGTDAYMAPEQCDPPNSGTPSYASDVFGLAATLYQAISGRRPFDDGDQSSEDVRERWPQLVQRPEPLTTNVTPEVAKIVEAGLALEPGDRPTPVELSDVLADALGRLPRGRLAGFKVR